MKMKISNIGQQKITESYVGIDTGKKNMVICRLYKNGKKEWLETKTTDNGIDELLKWLKKGDKIALECGNQAFRIAKMILSKTNYEVIVLNAGDLAVIYNSLKKTDKEDALKLA